MNKLLISVIFFTSTAVAQVHSESLTQFGNTAQLGVPIAAGAISLWKDDYEGLRQLAEGALYTAAATHTLKWVVKEDRPDGSSNDSFPSGHTSAATQGAAFLQFRYGWEYGAPAYAVSTLVGYSRVQADRHYWRDVGVGAVLATTIQYAVTRMDYSMSNVLFVPYVESNEVGFYSSLRF